MSNKQHDRQATRARTKRRDSKFERRSTRNRVIIVVMAVLMVLSLVGAALGALLGGDEGGPSAAGEPAADDPAATVGPCGTAPDDVPEIASQVYDQPFDLTIDPQATYVATIETTCGDVVIELDAAEAPAAVNSLVNLARDDYYDGVEFHRVVPGFVVQVGDPAGTGCGQADCQNFAPDAETFPGYTFEDELARAEELYEQVRSDAVEQLRAAAEAQGGDAVEQLDESLLEQVPGGYPRGTVAMANAGPDTNGSQFFIAHGDPTVLPGPQYTVLGSVVEGMDVVDAIAQSPTDPGGRPLETVAIRDVTIEQR